MGFLPDGYKTLEYVESTGSQKITLANLGSGGSVLSIGYFEFECEYTNITSTESALLSNYNNNSSNRWEIFSQSTSPYSSKYVFWNASSGDNVSSTLCTKRALFVYDASSDLTNQICLNGVPFGPVLYPSIIQPKTLFYYHDDYYFSSARVYHLLIKNTSQVVVMNLVPALRESGNLPGLYDTINDTFYASETGSPLIAGPYTANSNYDVYMGNNKFYIKMSDESLGIPSRDCATREEVAQYMRQMDDPNVSVSGNVATITFTPIPEYIARGMLKSKMVQFRVIRNKANQTTHRRIMNDSKGRYRAKNWIKETFGSGARYSHFTFDDEGYDSDNSHNQGPYVADVTILNTSIEQANSVITLQELTSGTIQRTCKWDYHYGGHNNNFHHTVYDAVYYGGSEYVYNQFKVGLVYYDENSIPRLFRVKPYNYPIHRV